MCEDILYIERLTMCAEHRNDTITFRNVRINIVVTITLHNVRQNIAEIAKLRQGAFLVLERKLKRILSYEAVNKNYFRQHITDIKNYLLQELE